MLKLQDITYSIESRTLIGNAVVTIPSGQKEGLVGRNFSIGLCV